MGARIGRRNCVRPAELICLATRKADDFERVGLPPAVMLVGRHEGFAVWELGSVT